MNMRFDLSSHLGKEIFDSLRSAPFQPYLLDYGIPKVKSFNRGLVLALSLLFSKDFKIFPKGSRIGVILPPGIAGFVSNFALLLSGRIPVNLNYTMGKELNLEVLKGAGVTTVVTASKMMKKFNEFPWPENCLLVDDFFKGVASKRFLILKTFIKAWIFPSWTSKEFEVPQYGGSGLAVLIFTSGSSGKPKGVRLTHANLLANCGQLYDLELFENQSKVLVNLPLFHSFGFTVGMLFSTLRGLHPVTSPSPLDHKLNLRIIFEQKVRILLGTPTFLRGYLKKAKKGELKSIQFVVAGAEKSPQTFRDRWEREADCQYLEGYGLTETSPAISFNLPATGKQSGSVGRLLPDVECQTIDPESGDITPLAEGGILCFRGPNIFDGYWQDAEHSNKVLDENGWFKTGDLGRLDRDGFLWIEGRSSRFSKIGGEMVPHGRVEEEITELLEICQTEVPRVVICSVENDQKGETLIVVSSFNCDLNQIKKGLKNRGLPNLWIPKELLLVKEIPILPTGKINWLKVRSFVTSRIKA